MEEKELAERGVSFSKFHRRAAAFPQRRNLVSQRIRCSQRLPITIQGMGNLQRYRSGPNNHSRL